MTRPAAADCPSEEAEASTALLFRTLGAHRVAVSRLATRSGSGRLRRRADDREQIQRQATLLRLLSIAEAFAAEMLLRQTERVVQPAAHPTVGAIWKRAAVEAVGGWSNQERAYKEWLGVDGKVVDWKPMHHLANARNAVAHGLGALTRQQQRDLKKVTAGLAAVHVPVVDGRVDLSEPALAHAAVLCRQFIAGLDSAVQRRPLAHR